MSHTTVSVRDVDEDVFRSFKAKSNEMGLNLGQALTLAVGDWIEAKRPKKRMLDFKSCDWGKETETVSTDIDSTLYR